MKAKGTTTVTTDHKLEIDEDSLLDMLRKAGHNVPQNAMAFVHIPGGGDWSNTDLPVADSPIMIEWTTIEKKEP